MDQPVQPDPANLPSNDGKEPAEPDPNTFDVSLVDTSAELERVELVPIAPPPLDPLKMDVTLATDPVPRLELLERSRWRWKFVALVGLVAFGVITPVSVLQFWGTFVTCQLLAEARQDAERTREETTKALEHSRKLYVDVVNDRREAVHLRGQLSMVRDQWEAAIGQAMQTTDSDARRQDLFDGMAKEAERLIEVIRREGLEHAAFLEAVVHECYHGDGVNPLVPKIPKVVVED